MIKNKRSRRYSSSEKREILKDAESLSFRELYVKYGIARETIRRWAVREEIAKGSKPASKRLSPEVVHEDDPSGSYRGYHKNWKEVLHLWKSRPGLGPVQIRNQLCRDGIKISVATVRNILEENGYTPPRAMVKEKEVRRYEAVRPRELVHLDFKHFFINKHKVFLLLLQDDASRFICAHRLSDSENMGAVIEAFEECVNRYGKMQAILTDAGSAFYSWNGLNKFQKLVAEEYGVDQVKASSPRSNGKVESVNKQIEKELLQVQYFESTDEANDAICEWIEFYNFERTHMGLPEGMVPADRFLYGWNRKRSTSVEKQKVAPEITKTSLNEAEPRSDIWEEILRAALKKIS